MQTLGLVAATTASLFWAIAVVLYRRVGRVMPPVRLNCTKGLVASVFIGGYVLVDWLVLDHAQWSLSPGLLVLMAVSGMIGIGVGDTFFFAGLNRLGARRMLLLFTINPVFTVVAAWLFLHESLTLWQIIGIGLTCSGVAWVIAERNTGKSDGHVDALGVFFGLAAATCQATGLLLSRYVFDQGEMSAGASAWLRVLAGSVVLLVLFPLDRFLRNPGGAAEVHPTPPSRTRATLMFAIAMMLGTVGGISLMQVSVKYAGELGVASTLLSTSPLFVLPIAAMLGETISKRAILGAIITIAGVALLYSMSG